MEENVFTTESGYTFRKGEDNVWRCGNIISVTEYQDGTFLSTIRASHDDGLLSYPKTIPSSNGHTLQEVAELTCKAYELQNDLENETRRISGELAKVERALRDDAFLTFGDCTFKRRFGCLVAEVNEYKVSVCLNLLDGRYRTTIDHSLIGQVLRLSVEANNERDAACTAARLFDMIRNAAGEA